MANNNCKYYKEEEYQSLDGGITWTAMGVYRKGDLIEYDSEDCGYVPPVPSNAKFIARYFVNTPVSAECDSTSSITSGDVTNLLDLAELEIGDCVTAITLAAIAEWSNGCPISSLTLGNSIVTIEDYAFWKCANLPNVTFPNTLTTIGCMAFYMCNSLTSVTIPDSVTRIDGGAFGYCSNLQTVTIGSGVTAIGTSGNWSSAGSAFFNCHSITSVTINATTPPTLIGDNNFASSNNYPIYVPCASVDAYKAATNWSTYADRIQGIPPCGEPTFDGKFKATYSSGGRTYSAACDGDTTLTSGNTKPSGYDYSAMTTAEIGDCVTTIGDSAFQYCSSLTSVTIPNTVTSIGEYSFHDCYSLSSVTIPDSVTSIGNNAFSWCDSLTSCTIGTGVTSIGNNAFWVCSGLTSVTIPNSVTSIGYGAFSSCQSLTSVTIPDSVTSINNLTFSNCYSLSSVTIPDSITSIGNDAFRHCSGLTSVTIPDSVTSIGNDAFYDCYSLSSVTIPDSVTSIGEGAFDWCTGLTSVTVEVTTPPTLGNNAFYNTNNCPIYVPCASVGAYKSATYWSDYKSRIQAIPFSCPALIGKFNVTDTTSPTKIAALIDGFNSIEIDGIVQPTVESAYTFDTTGEHVVKYSLKNSINIGDGAFRACSGLSSVTIPDSVTSIGQFAFRDCTGLTSVTIGSGITSIDFASFYQCSSLTSCTINAQQPPTLGDSAIYRTNNCPIYVSCASVDAYKAAIGWSTYADRIQGIPPCSEPTPTGGTKFSATYTGGRTYSAACDGNTTLTSGDTRPSGYVASAMTTAEIGDCVTIIGYRAFAWCYSLPSITIPDSVTSIGDDAFYGCVNFKRLNSSTDGVLNIPSGVTSIGNDAFAGCSGLTSVVIPDSVTSIGGAFPNCNNLTNVAIGSGVTSIGNSAFVNCRSLSSITIPNSVTSIGNDTFWNCYNLTNVAIGSGVTNIGDSAFSKCSSLTSVTINASIPPTLSGLSVFSSTPIASGTGNIYVPAESVNAYKAANGWSKHASRIQPIT